MSNFIPFILSEEIFRLNNASSYEAYILKCKIDEFMRKTKTKEEISNFVSYGSKFYYYDAGKDNEEIIVIKDILDESVTGERQSDGKIINIPIESISLKKTPYAEGKEGREDVDGFNATPLEKIAVEHWCYGKNYVTSRHFMLAYLVSYTWNTCKLKLLGGDLVTLNRHNYNLYKPNTKELNDFQQIENDKYFIEKEFNRTISLTKEHMDSPNIENNFTINKFKRYLSTRGCTDKNIIESIEYVKNNYSDKEGVAKYFLKKYVIKNNQGSRYLVKNLVHPWTKSTRQRAKCNGPDRPASGTLR